MPLYHARLLATVQQQQCTGTDNCRKPAPAISSGFAQFPARPLRGACRPLDPWTLPRKVPLVRVLE
eukprot:5597599-Alexandrium_andersonii.AAC.1